MKSNRIAIDLTAADQAQLTSNIARWRLDPVAYVNEVFAAGWEAAHPGKKFELEKWHSKALSALIGKSPRIAAKAAKGVGKTAFLAWVGLWFVTCFPHAKAAATSVTGDNLDTGLWTELAVWMGFSPLLLTLFEHTATELRARHHPKTWKLSRRTFAVDAEAGKQSESMAGLHADHVLVLIDEAGAVPVGVFRAAEGIFNDTNAHALLVAVGNANDIDGPLGIICTQEAERWSLIEITGDPDDPDRCTRVDINEAREQIRLHTRNDPVVRVNILGLFPLRGSNKLLGSDEVAAAMRRDSPKREWNDDPVIFGLDAALDGDDSNVLAKRQGTMSWLKAEWQWRNVKPRQLADMLGVILNKHQGYGALFIDITGGWGNSVMLRLEDLGFPNIIGVDFGAPALDSQFANRRAEMHFLMADWVKSFGCLTDDPFLRAELCAPSYGTTTKGGHTVRIVEPKKDIKARLGRSPDKSDALALTFAAPVFKQDPNEKHAFHGRTPGDKPFNPYAHMRGER